MKLKLYILNLLLIFNITLFGQSVSHIDFYVDTDSIIENANYKLFIDSFIPMINDNIDRIIKIDIISSASPEGNHNDYLSNIRANKIITLLPKHNNISIYSIGEEYNMLDSIISKSNEPYKNDVLDILRTHKYIKQDLKRLHNGKVWNDMLIKYFPKLRQTTIIVYFDCEENKLTYNILPINETDNITIIQHDTIYINDCIKFEKKPIVAVKTNLLLDCIAALNIQAEIYMWLWGLSLEFEYTFPWWSNDPKHFYYQLLNGTGGIRKYFNNQYTKWWVGIYGNTGYYDFCFKDNNGFQGEHYGLGIGCGYVFQYKKWKRLKFEPYIRLGWINTTYDKYYTSDPYINKYYYTVDGNIRNFRPRDRHANYFGPIMIGFNFTYDIINIWTKKK